MKITRKGLHELYGPDGLLISRHTDTDEAYESAYAHAAGLPPGLHTYRIKPAEKEFEVSTLSRTVFSADTTAPTVPGSVSASALSSSAIRTTWTASTDTGGSGLRGYRVYRSTTSGGTYTQVGSDLTTASLSYDDTGLSASTTRFYKVRAFDGNGNESALSSAVSATTQADAPSSSGFIAEDGFTVFAPDGFADGAEVTISRPAGGFGSPALAPPQFFDRVESQLFAGVEMDVYSAIPAGSPVPTGSSYIYGDNRDNAMRIESSGERYGNRTRVYRSDGTQGNTFLDIRGSGRYPSPAEAGKKFYASWRIRPTWTINDPSPSSHKYIRVWDSFGSSEDHTRMSWTQRQVDSQIDKGSATNFGMGSTHAPANTWHRLEVFVDFGNQILRCWFNGVLKGSDAAANPSGRLFASPSSVGAVPRLIGHNPSGADAFTAGVDTFSMSDIWFDNKRERFEVWNASTRAAATIIEPQPAKLNEWSDTSVTLNPNQGALPAGAAGCTLVFHDADGNDTVIGSWS